MCDSWRMKALQLRLVLHICKKEAATCFSLLVLATAVSVDQNIEMFVCNLAKHVRLGRTAWTKPQASCVGRKWVCVSCRRSPSTVLVSPICSHVVTKLSVLAERQLTKPGKLCLEKMGVSCAGSPYPPCWFHTN